MKLSPSWEAANYAATQGLPSILWNPKVHHRVHKSPQLVSILSQIDPVYTTRSYLCKIHFNIVHPLNVLVFVVVSFLAAFRQNPICIPLLPIYVTFSAQLILLDFIIIFGEEYKLRSSALCIIVVYILIFMFLDSRREDNRFWTEW
jgi:hypothetical protein